MSRDSREEVVDGLELETAMEPVQPGSAINIHRGAKHPLRKGFMHPEVSGRHSEVRKCDLHMQRRGDHMRDHDEYEATARIGNGAVHHIVAEPYPEEYLTRDLEPAVPPGWALPGTLSQDEVLPTQTVEVEAAKEKDWVVQVVLILQHKLGKCIKLQNSVVIRAA